MYQANTNQKKPALAMFTLNKMDFKTKAKRAAM